VQRLISGFVPRADVSLEFCDKEATLVNMRGEISLRACLKTQKNLINPQILLYFFDHLPQQTGDAIHS